jgi:signal transduction histidine kinase
LLSLAVICNRQLAAQSYLTASDSVKIATYLQQAAQRKAVQDWRGASDFINKAALTYWDAREFQKAIHLFHQSLVLNQLVDNRSGIFGIDNNLAFLHADLQQYDSSVHYFKKVLEGRRQQQASEPIISALANLSVVYSKLKRYEESVKVLEEALELARSENNLERMRTCYAFLAETYEKMGDLKKTQEYFERYKSLVEMLNKAQFSALSEQISKEQEARRQTEEARRIAEIEARLQEEALSRATQRLTAQDSAIASLNERYTKIQMAVEILRQDSIIKSFEIERLKYETKYRQERLHFYLSIGIGILIIAFLTIGFLYRLKENKTREAKLLQLKNNQLAEQKTEIARQAEQLSRLNIRLKQLFSIIGHDLRAPVISLHGVLELLLLKAIDAKDFDSLLPNLHNNVTQLMATLDNLLLWGKADESQSTSAKEHVPLFEAVQGVMNLLSLAAQQKQISLQNRVAPDIKVHFNQFALQTILRNLVNNAIKFTPERGTVIVASEQQAEHCILSICDNGVGISPEKLENLLEGNFTTRGTAGEVGTGLGIHLCKNLCIHNGAQLAVESKLGKGTTWQIYMQLATKQS